MYAAGRIPGSFFRREGRPSEDAILTCRLIDRPLRPTFIKGLRNEVQVVITVLALNPDHAYDVVAINAASASTQLSGLPFSGPVGATRVALIDGQWVAFPTHSELGAGHVQHGRRRPRALLGRRRDHDGRGRGHRGHHRADRGRRHPADRRGRRRGPRGGQAVHRRGVPRAEPSWPQSRPSRSPSSRCSWTTRTTCSPRCPTRSSEAAGPGADHRRQAGARESNWTASRRRPRRSSAPRSRVARTRSARRSARSPRSSCASASCATRCASTAAAWPTSARSRPRSRSSRGCTVRRCSSAARRRSSASPR